MKKIEILSLGGSLFCPEKLDTDFLKKFKNFILKWIKRGKRFVIFVGGGKIARNYQTVAKEFKVLKNEELDWIGISATHLNATLLKSLFYNLSFPRVISDPRKKINTKNKIIICCGWKPGWSTDFDAVLMAKNLKVKRIINLSNVDFVYDKDPKKFKGAKPFIKISFDELLKITGKKWNPGANLPFDPQASKLAKKENIKVIILNGKNFKNLNLLLKGQKFKGTIVE